MRQSNSGADAIQVGEVHGNLTIVQVAAQSVGDGQAKRLRMEQARVLRLLARVSNRKSILEFMRREFGTSMVKDLTFPQLYRVKKYTEAVARREGDLAHGRASKKREPQ
eukprot:TRINITY_DN27237_c0_g1_i1.p3 TRINITY_DN27237_c0_g1~~TRINITY_DN27237_c0_g1_i1.p3  ORF type:complete len:109 (-),score=15.78 TRINITY_DN27237_c0_g1_i1:480-806(-)